MIIPLHPDTIERAEFVRHAINNIPGGHVFTERDFNHTVFLVGLIKYELQILPDLTGIEYKPYYLRKSPNLITGQDQEKIENRYIFGA